MTAINFDEIGQLLALIAARDQRTTGEADILAWHADLNVNDIDYQEAADAVTHFYAIRMARLEDTNRWRITSADVIARVNAVRRQRLENFRYEPSGPEETTEEYLRRLREQKWQVSRGLRPAGLPPAGGPRSVPELVAGRVLDSELES